MNCRYCGKECKNKNSLAQHEIRCAHNPNKIKSGIEIFNEKVKTGILDKTAYHNRFTKAKHLGLPIPIVTDETKALISERNRTRKHSEETKHKISESYKQYLKEHPEKVGFVINHSSKQSYPEQYFEKVFLNENIDLKYHKQVGRYELDFYNDDLMKYVEIDGNQHKSEYMRKHDAERDNYLLNLGWKGYRVDWSYYKSLSIEKRKDIISDIRKFLYE